MSEARSSDPFGAGDQDAATFPARHNIGVSEPEEIWRAIPGSVNAFIQGPKFTLQPSGSSDAEWTVIRAAASDSSAAFRASAAYHRRCDRQRR